MYMFLSLACIMQAFRAHHHCHQRRPYPLNCVMLLLQVTGVYAVKNRVEHKDFLKMYTSFIEQPTIGQKKDGTKPTVHNNLAPRFVPSFLFFVVALYLPQNNIQKLRKRLSILMQFFVSIFSSGMSPPFTFNPTDDSRPALDSETNTTWQVSAHSFCFYLLCMSAFSPDNRCGGLQFCWERCECVWWFVRVVLGQFARWYVVVLANGTYLVCKSIGL